MAERSVPLPVTTGGAMTLIMYDTVDPAQFVGLPMDAAAGYVDGAWPTFSTLGRYVPKGTQLVSISVFGNPADCIDVEPGNVTNDQGARWAQQRIAAGAWKPIVYTGAANARDMLWTLAAYGVTRQQIRLWTAHYGTGEHFCGPGTCGYVDQPADGTQWTDVAHGRNLDQSVLAADFFQAAPPAAPPSRQAKHGGDDSMQVVFGADSKAGIPVPKYATHLRLASAQQVTVNWAWPGTSSKGSVALNGSRGDVALPAGQGGLVVLTLASGVGPVYATWVLS